MVKKLLSILLVLALVLSLMPSVFAVNEENTPCLHSSSHWESSDPNDADNDTYVKICDNCGEQLSSCSNHASGKKSFVTSRDENGNEIVKCANCYKVYNCDHPAEYVTYVKGAGSGYPCKGECSKCGYTWVNTHDADVSDGWQEIVENGVTKCQLTCKTCGRVLATHTTEGAWYTDGNGNCVWKCKNCVTNNSVAVPRRVLNDADHQTHKTTFGAWSAPGVNGNTYSNACKRVCTGNSTCTTYETHRTSGTWVYSDDGTSATLNCTYEGCNSTQTCTQHRYGAWSTDGTTCTRKCYTCSYTQTHTTNLGNYETASNVTARKCTEKDCTATDKIDTVEELQAAITQGLTTIQPNTTITITDNVIISGGADGITIKRTGESKPTFVVAEGGSLTLNNVTVDGNNKGGDSMIEVNGGTLVLNSSTLQGCTYSSASAIYLSSGNVVMNDGSYIKNCSSGNDSGIVLITGGTFTLNGGTLTNNRYGTTILLEGYTPTSAKFIMNGGTITGNSGDYMYGTVQIVNGTAEIKGGYINDNLGGLGSDRFAISGGVTLYSGSLTIDEGATITGNKGANVLVYGYRYSSDSGDDAYTIVEPNIVINGGTITGAVASAGAGGGSADVAIIDATGTINGGNIGTFISNDEYEELYESMALSSFVSSNYGMSYDELLEYIGDYYTGEQLLEMFREDGLDTTPPVLTTLPEIYGGTFGTNVTNYCASGYVATKQTDGTYKIEKAKTVENAATKVTASESHAEGTNVSKVTATIEGSSYLETYKLQEAAGKVASGTTISATAEGGDVTASFTTGETTAQEASDALTKLEALEALKLDADGNSDKTVSIIHEVYLDVDVQEYNSTSESKSITLDITPKYNVIATTAAKDEKQTSANTVTVATGKTATVTTAVDVSVALDNSFYGEATQAFITHTHDGKTYIYRGTIDANGVLTFNNPNGFSTFVVTLSDPSTASIPGADKYFTTLQEAVNAVKDGDTIVLSGKNDENIVVAKTISFSIKGDATNIKSGNYTKLTTTVDGDTTLYKFVYTAPVYGNNGDNNTDDEPGGDDDTPTTTGTFTDVPDGQWYSDAVAYCAANNLMDGTGNGKFEPMKNVTRAMAITTLYRLAGSPEVSGTNDFTDLTRDWYKAAVQWGVNIGITNGKTATTFDPDAAITREQLAAMFYRYATAMNIDTTAKADLSGYTDSGKISSYAVDAMQWANAAGIVTGTSATTLAPTNTSNRATLATILMRFNENNKAE